jgi:hypothetical protein
VKKIISLFARNYEGDGLVRDEIVLGAEWVINGEGIPTRKFDGTCCLIRDGKFFKRYDAKRGKIPPANFEPAQEYDEITGHMPGWIPVGCGNEDKWHREAFENQPNLPDGTYELCGPKVQRDAEIIYRKHELGDESNLHILVKHGCYVFDSVPVSFDALREWLMEMDIEGVVWHHPDGRMVKIKKRDFGLKRIGGNCNE